MRSIVLVPLAALVAAAAGCGSEASESATRAIPQRDITLVPQSSDMKFASALETQRVPAHQTVHHTRWAARLAAAEKVPAPVLAVPQPVAEPVAQPATTEATPANDRELLPGKTVTVIPVSSGPSIGTDKTAEPRSDRGRTEVAGGGGGGRCGGRGRGRGPGIGMVPAPRPDFR